MKILTIDRKDCRLDFEKEHVVLSYPERRMTIPAKQVERIIVAASQAVHTRIFAQLVKHNIGLIIVNRHAHLPPAIVVGASHGDHLRKLRQYQLIANPKARVAIARQLVIGKIRAQMYCLKKALRKRPGCRKELNDALNVFSDLLVAVREQTLDLERLRGYEGAAASAYFRAYTALFSSHWNFTRRIRRPPPDPVNALLSLSYTLLYGEALIAIQTTGLEPGIGVLHEPEYGRQSLACDLQELYRAKLDFWVWRLLAERIIRPTHFNAQTEWQTNGCFLNKAGRQIFYPLWSQGVPALARHMVLLMRRQQKIWFSREQDKLNGQVL